MREFDDFTLISGERETGEYIRESKAPHSVDINLTGRCQLRCNWCWGPEHNLHESVTETQWGGLIGQLAEDGTSQIVFTGGEPLMAQPLPNMLRLAKELDIRTTLSTNAILLAERSELLQYVDDLGIPLDGATAGMNDTMRERSARHGAWGKAIDGIRLAQAFDVPVTVRTVVSRKNLHDVRNIPQSLRDQGVDISRIRHKLYQVEPVGPHAENIDFDDWSVSEDEATQAAALTKERYPELNVALQLYKNTKGRYFQIEQFGDSYGTDVDEDGLPIRVAYGNMFEDYDGCLAVYSQHKSRD